jgi:hypothetical protein
MHRLRRTLQRRIYVSQRNIPQERGSAAQGDTRAAQGGNGKPTDKLPGYHYFPSMVAPWSLRDRFPLPPGDGVPDGFKLMLHSKIGGIAANNLVLLN